MSFYDFDVQALDGSSADLHDRAGCLQGPDLPATLLVLRSRSAEIEKRK